MNKNKSISTDQHNIKINKLIKISKAPPKITMDDPDFVKLTAAEKLNDSDYRCLIYRAYSNEPTCNCTPINVQRSSNSQLTIDKHHNNSSVNFPRKCPGGCESSCCSTLKHSPNNENNGNDDKMVRGSVSSSHCIENQRTNELYNGSSTDKRIRGGGGGGYLAEEVYHKTTDAIETECTKNLCWKHDGNNSLGVTCPRFTDHLAKSRGINKNELNYNSMVGCWCSGREKLFINNKGNVSRQDEWKKRYSEIDRYVRALEDAQEFVDSLGKVPGMVGLGLMDPSERPYFRANKIITDEQSSNIMINDNDNNNLMQLPMINSQYVGPCNPHGKSLTSTSPWIKAKPFTISVPGRGGIVREAILPETRGELPEEIIQESGPCGDFKCKSRRKKIINHVASINNVGNIEKLDEVDEQNFKSQSKNNKLHKRKKKKLITGPDGDGTFKSKKSQRSNYVYFAGETYPGFIYGHKNCNDRPKRVPPHMGWLWNQYQAVGYLKPRVGWRPGAISREIREIISETKVGLERSRRRPTSVPSIGMRGKKLKTRSHASLKKGHMKKLEEEIDEAEPPPTLHIQRRNGDYHITMYPIRQETMDIPKLDEPIKPLQFMIPKRKNDSSNESSSTASDMDIEFSPPAAVNRYKKKPNVIHTETQVKQKDIVGTLKPVDSKSKEIIVEEKKSKKKKRKKSRKRKKN